MVRLNGRWLQIITLMVLVFGGLMLPHASAAQAETNQDRREVNRTLADLSRAERADDFQLLYDLMLPEARMMMPRQSFMNWYPDVAPDAPKDALKIESITFDDVTYELTDTDFGNVATVEYSYHNADGNLVNRTMRLAEVDGIWRWLPELTPDQIPAIQAEAGYTVRYESPYSSDLYVELDTFWAQIFSDWGKDYRSPKDMVGVRRAGTPTGCGPIDDPNAIFAHYCTLDETIYFNPDQRDVIIDRVGLSAWEMVMAHEWGHHIQNISGMYVTKSPELLGGHYSIEHELQADCLAGTFLQDATVRGHFDSRSRRELDAMIGMAADAPNTTWDDITAHGTADQRRDSFYTGYDDGLRGCHLRA